VRTSILDGVSLSSLTSQLATMQQAYLALASGQQIVTASYAQGDGSRSVTYRQPDLANLTQSIISVQTQIDALNGARINRRKPLRPYF